MNAGELEATARAMVPSGKGILAMDESNPSCAKRFKPVGIECTEETRQAYRELLLTTPGLSEFVSGAILFDETIRQTLTDGTPFPVHMSRAGIIPGIKVDAGAKDLAGFPGEKVTEGLDGLRDRLAEYKEIGAQFTKWRAVITIGDGIPTRGCMEINAHALARYAGLSQEAGLVPMVEPEVLINGDHTIGRCCEVTEETLRAVFSQLAAQRVRLEGVILKASMVISGLDCPNRAGVKEVAAQTVRCLLNTVPPAVPGVVFLSGGQGNQEATAHLNAMHSLGKDLPWALTFSYARALQQPALEAWRGDVANVAAAQKAFYHRTKLNGAAALGRYNEKMEKEAA
ncbi:MAG: class I fructose-bisphosphate aldolase [Acidiferrobacterales bacterium]